MEPDCFPSPITSRSYLFHDDILGTSPQGTLPTDAQVRPTNYPADAIGLANGDRVSLGPLDYDLDPEVIRDHRDTLVQELLALPAISVISPVGDLFGIDQGIYSNSSLTKNDKLDPFDNQWRRLISLEYFDPVNPFNNASENAELLITGDTSRSFGATDKHSMRFRFRSGLSRTGRSTLRFAGDIFPSASTKDFNQLNLRHPTQDSFTLKWNPPNTACYIRSSFAQELHARMGTANGGQRHLKPNHRWVHLFLNGLHWGVYDLSERVDEDFAQTYGFGTADYDILSHSGDVSFPTDHDGIVDGSYHAWDTLRTLCEAAAAALPAANSQTEWLSVHAFLDLENYIDYLLVGMYLNHRDWPKKNFRIMRRRGPSENLNPDSPPIYDPLNPNDFNPGGKFQFIVWDAESSMQYFSDLPDRVLATINAPIDERGVAEFHHLLRNHPAYQELFRQRTALHFTTTGGLLTPDPITGVIPGYTSFPDEMAAFAGTFDSNDNPLTYGGLFMESARWGDSRKSATGTTYTYSDPSYRPTSALGDWKRNTPFYQGYDSSRRSTFLNLLRSQNLADPE